MAGTLEIPVDTINESVVIAAAIVDEAAADRLTRSLRPDHFHLGEHRAAWAGILELRRRKLAYDPATLRALCGNAVSLEYLSQLAAQRPEAPANLGFHVDAVLWNHARVEAARGPLQKLLEAFKDPTSPSDSVRALARMVAESFDGYQDRGYLKEPDELVRSRMLDMDERIAGRATHPFGVDGLDYYEDGYSEGAARYTRHRLIPGCAPRKITLVTGVTGSGKSLLIKYLVNALVRHRKQRILYGAWEDDPDEVLEELAVMSLNLSKTAVATRPTPDMKAAIRQRMELISGYVRFADLPFGRTRGARPSNEANMDKIHGYIADTAPDVFVADLWERALASSEPDDEKDALYRQQAMAKETGVHVIIGHQQRVGELEKRKSPKPTREGVKGSKAYVEVADLVLGTYRDALYKAVPDDRFQVCILKQRKAPWPMIVEFESDIDRGILKGGVTLPYEASPERADDPLSVPKATVRTRKGARDV